MISRRSFVGRALLGGAGIAVGEGAAVAFAEPLGLPLGLQLFSVRQQLAKDFAGTLAQLSALGYQEVESAGFMQMTPVEVKRAMDKANLRCVSAHVPFATLQPKFDETLAFNKELGVEYLICSSPGFKTPPPEGGTNRGRKMTIEDWHFNAEQFNAMGEKASAAGLKFGYHNHVAEFATADGVVPYLELLRLTDPRKVTMELDCGWAVVGGMKPVDLLRDYPGRFSMLHVKDFKAAVPGEHEPPVTELGQGSIDYAPIFRQAEKTQKLRHTFVEQEAFDMPWEQSLKVDAQYMRALKV